MNLRGKQFICCISVHFNPYYAWVYHLYLLKEKRCISILQYVSICVDMCSHTHIHMGTPIRLSSGHGKKPNLFLHCQKVIQKQIKIFHIWKSSKPGFWIVASYLCADVLLCLMTEQDLAAPHPLELAIIQNEHQ